MHCLLLFIVCIVWDVESLDNSYDLYRKVYIKVYLGGASDASSQIPYSNISIGWMNTDIKYFDALV